MFTTVELSHVSMWISNTHQTLISIKLLLIFFRFYIHAITSIKWQTWRRHDAETYPALLALCEESTRSPEDSPDKGPAMQSFDIFFAVIQNQLSNKTLDLLAFWDTMTSQ